MDGFTAENQTLAAMHSLKLADYAMPEGWRLRGDKLLRIIRVVANDGQFGA
ncbi:MAG TPA: hypothetical protein PLG50_01160 [bacterium]|nr:hypothetical protein [bacterium]